MIRPEAGTGSGDFLRDFEIKNEKELFCAYTAGPPHEKSASFSAFLKESRRSIVRKIH